MYFYLHGLVTMHTADSVVVECNGVGYDCLVSHPSDFPIGENMFVFTALYTHEDDSFLIGFKTLEEKNFYGKLTSVSGVGPKTAMNILSSTSIDRLKKAIEESDQVFLTNLPGIGKKTASQIILDLKGKLVDAAVSPLSEKNLALAYDGLKGLGFKTKEINDAFARITERNLSVEEYMTRALKLLNQAGYGQR